MSGVLTVVPSPCRGPRYPARSMSSAPRACASVRPARSSGLSSLLIVASISSLEFGYSRWKLEGSYVAPFAARMTVYRSSRVRASIGWKRRASARQHGAVVVDVDVVVDRDDELELGHRPDGGQHRVHLLPALPALDRGRLLERHVAMEAVAAGRHVDGTEAARDAPRRPVDRDLLADRGEIRGIGMAREADLEDRVRPMRDRGDLGQRAALDAAVRARHVGEGRLVEPLARQDPALR